MTETNLVDDGESKEKESSNKATSSISKLDTLSREDLLRHLKKQTINLKEARKQIETLQNQLVDAKREKEKAQDHSQQNGTEISKSDLISLELSDYKKSLDQAQKQLAHAKDGLAEKDTLIRDLTERIDTVSQEKALIEETVKELKTSLSKIEKEIKEKDMTIMENAKENHALSLQINQLRADFESEIDDLKATIKRQKDELSQQRDGFSSRNSEMRNLRSQCELLQRQYDDLNVEYNTFKERAQYVLKQKTEEKPVTQTSTYEIEELLKTLAMRNEKISQISEKCNILEEELHAAQEHARNLRAELTDSQASLNSLQQRQADERRRLHADYESRLRQNSATIDALNKELTQLRDQFSEEKNRLIETFNRQTSELTLQNQHLTEKIIELNSAMKKTNDTENHTIKEVNRTQQKNIEDRIRTQLSKVPKPIDFSNNVRLSTENSNEHFVSETENSDADDLRSLQSILNGEDLDETQTICDDFPSMQSSFMDGISNQEDVCVKLQHTREMLSETEEINVKLMEQVKILKEEIRRMERNIEREQHINNTEYFKNVMLKFLAPPKVNDERVQLLPVLRTMLRLSPEETELVSNIVNESNQASGSQNSEWTSYLFSNML
uniref:GRIP domain-containing protein n=1 Tax=Acrobeloides nanus TaxID=290746 RepID=A0A914BXZ5_9BILA